MRISRWWFPHKFCELAISAFILASTYVLLYAAINTLSLSLALIGCALFVVGLIRRGSTILNDLIFLFVTMFGFSAIFGWLDLPVWINPAIAVLSIWNLMNVRCPTRGFIPGIKVLPPLMMGAYFTWYWWKDLAQGTPSHILGRLFAIWDMSAHFYFFNANLEHNTYIPMIASPDDLGRNAWAALEYPTGIHYVWSRLVSESDRSRYVLEPTESLSFFANSVVLTYAACIFVIGASIVRAFPDTSRTTLVSLFSSGIASLTIGLGVISQTITFGFVNIGVVLAAAAASISILVRPIQSRIFQHATLGCALLTISYNWYPVVLLLGPAVFVWAVIEFRKSNLRTRFLILQFWIAVSSLGLLPVIQTLSLGISHLAVDGGVAALSANTSLLVVLTGVVAMVLFKNRLNVVEIALLGSPVVAYIILTTYFRIYRTQYPYYFQKINIFLVLVLFLTVLVVAVRSNWFRKHFLLLSDGSRLGKFVRSGVRMTLSVLLLSQVFGYVGPDAVLLGRDDAMEGLKFRSRALDVSEIDMRTVALIQLAAKNARALPLNERAWLTLVLPERVLQAGTTDGSRIILTNIWLHTLTRSQTLTAWETSYVAANIETRGALRSDSDIADTMKNIFQPDSVIVYSTADVIEKLSAEPLPWRTFEFPERLVGELKFGD